MQSRLVIGSLTIVSLEIYLAIPRERVDAYGDPSHLNNNHNDDDE